MIEVKRKPQDRLTGYNGMDAAVAKGVFMYNAGAFAAAHIPVGTAGYASLGDSPRMLLANQYIHSGFGVFPVNKIILQTEGAEQSLDTIPSGVRMLYYVGGEFETDEYDVTVSGTGTKPGDKLWLNSAGQISLSTGGAGEPDPVGWNLPPIGEVVKVSDYPATANWSNGGVTGQLKKTVWFRLYPWHQHAVGNQFPSL